MIDIKNLSKDYSQLKIIDNASVYLPSRGLFMIKGPSGSGKSTLLYILYNLIKEYQGQVIVAGENIKNFNEKRSCLYKKYHISLMLQSNQLINTLTPLENIELTNKNPILTAKLAKIFKVSHLLDKESKHLSLGEKARINLIRVLINNTPIILLDEPFASLDIQMQEIIIKYLKKISTTKLIIFNSHIIDNITSYVDNVIELKDKKIVLTNNINNSKNNRYPSVKIKPTTLNKLTYKFIKKDFKTLFLLGIINSIGVMIIIIGFLIQTVISQTILNSLPSIIAKDRINASGITSPYLLLEEVENLNIFEEVKIVKTLKSDIVYLTSQNLAIPFSSQIIIDDTLNENELVIKSTSPLPFQKLVIDNYLFSLPKYSIQISSKNQISCQSIDSFYHIFKNQIPDIFFNQLLLVKYQEQNKQEIINFAQKNNLLLKSSDNINYFYLYSRPNYDYPQIILNDFFYSIGSDIYLNQFNLPPLKYQIYSKFLSPLDIVISTKLKDLLKTDYLSLTIIAKNSIFDNQQSHQITTINLNIVDVIDSEELIIYQNHDWNLKLYYHLFNITDIEFQSDHSIIITDSDNIKEEINNLKKDYPSIDFSSFYLQTIDYLTDFTNFVIYYTSFIAFLLIFLASLVLLISLKYIKIKGDDEYGLLTKLGFSSNDLVYIQSGQYLLIGLTTFSFSNLFLLTLTNFKNQNFIIGFESNNKQILIDIFNFNPSLKHFLLIFIFSFLLPLILLVYQKIKLLINKLSISAK